MSFLTYVSRSMKTANCILYRHTLLSREFKFLNQLPLFNFCFTRKCSSKEIEWKPFYRFPYIVPVRALNRLKLHQTFLSVIAIPVTSIMYNEGLVDFTTVKMFLTFGVIASLTLYPITWFFRKVVGIMFISKDGNLVQISHLTFWGNRRNIIVPKEDIIPLTDCEYNPSDLYVKIQRYSVPDVLFFTLRYGEILHKEEFKDVFGDLKIIGYSNKK